MLRVRFHKQCSAARRLWLPGEEADFTDDLAHEIAGLGAAEIIGPGEAPDAAAVPPAPTSAKPPRSVKPRTQG